MPIAQAHRLHVMSIKPHKLLSLLPQSLCTAVGFAPGVTFSIQLINNLS